MSDHKLTNIRQAINEEIHGPHNLVSCSESIFEISNLMLTGESIDNKAVANLLFLLHEKINNNINQIDNLVKQLES